MREVSPEPECDNYAFVAKLDNVKKLSQLLKAIHVRDLATVDINEIGMRVIVEEAKCVQAIAFVQRELFDDFIVKDERVVFDINLKVLLDCLTMFGSSGTAAAMRMCYSGEGSPLVLFLEEAGVLTDCEIRTLEASDVMDFNLSKDNVINVIIFRSESLKEVWSELDTSSETVEILMSPDEPYFRLTTRGTAGTVQIEYTRTSDMIDSFDCKKLLKTAYKLMLLKHSFKAMNLSSRVALRTDCDGLLGLQFLIKTDEGVSTFVEFYCTPDEALED
ncbi:cell cycle checkpoint protein RAD1-like [Ornithodoros turicata]|uniref:cell cycle checkpoint protein RAD1-like n=1 Tax=Ornithodoros turicata TaxID=34597 RepID=UPI003139C385